MEKRFNESVHNAEREINDSLSDVQTDLGKANDEAELAKKLCKKANNDKCRAEALVSKLNAQLKDANDKLDKLPSSAANVEELNLQISELQDQSNKNANIAEELRKVVLRQDKDFARVDSENEEMKSQIQKKNLELSRDREQLQKLSDDAANSETLRKALNDNLVKVTQEKERADNALQLSEERLNSLSGTESTVIQELKKKNDQLQGGLISSNGSLKKAKEELKEINETFNRQILIEKVRKAMTAGVLPPRGDKFRFIVRTFDVNWNYGDCPLDDIDELCLSESGEFVTANVIRLILSEILNQYSVQQVNGGLNADNFYFYYPELFRFINRAECKKNTYYCYVDFKALQCVFLVMKKFEPISDEEVDDFEYLLQITEGEEVVDADDDINPRPLLHAPKPHNWKQRWSLCENRSDYFSRKSTCVGKVVEYDINRDHILGRSNNMFVKTGGIFFIIQLT